MAGTSMKQAWVRLAHFARLARGLPPERRLAALGAVGLVCALFLPWYQETVVDNMLKMGTASLTGWGVFSWIEAVLLLVAMGVLTLLFQRAEGRVFHIPGGDGRVIAAAGAWAGVLVIWRLFDRPGASGHGAYAASSGLDWGIFVALAMAGVLAYAGRRIRAAHQPEPPPEKSESDPVAAHAPASRAASTPLGRSRRAGARGAAKRSPRLRVVTPSAGRVVTASAGRVVTPPAGRVVSSSAATAQGEQRRLFDDDHPMYERPEWSGSEIGAFEPETRRSPRTAPTVSTPGTARAASSARAATSGASTAAETSPSEH